MTYQDKPYLYDLSVGHYMGATSLTPQKKPYPRRSISPHAKAINFRFPSVTITLVIHVNRGAGQRQPSITSRQPLGLHPAQTGIINSFRVITPWQSCFLTKAGSVMRALTLNNPSHARSIVDTAWVW